MNTCFAVLVIIYLTFGVSSLPTGVKKEVRRKNLHHLLHSHLSEDTSTKCTICKDVTAFLHGIGSVGIGENELITIATYICNKAKIESNRVCVSVVKEFANEVWNVFIDAFVQPDKVCGWVLGDTCADFVDYFSPWYITIPPRTKKDIDNSWKIQKKASVAKTWKVLQLSDIHLDNDYMEGSLAICSEPLCCRKEDGKAGEGQTAAPKWGYNGFCDSNILMVQSLFENLVKNHNDTDYILWTGDVPAHNVWNQTKQDQINAIRQATELFIKYFPDKKVYPCLGNHEGVPVNSFPPPYVTGAQSGQWLLDAIAEDWVKWLPEETTETIKIGGYYTVLLQKGFRLISLNMNYGHSGNWWLWINSTDPAGQLQWLVGVLLKAEENNEKVHIIGHVPPNEVLKWYSYNYYQIINRFHDTITAQFFGHTHHDEFRVFYDAKTYKTPINIAYVGPSVTTYQYMNPGYRIYEVDGGSANSTWAVTDHHTYIFDIREVAKTGIPKWEHEYSAKAAYGLTSLSPAAWNDLSHRMLNDDKLFQILYRAFTKQYIRGACTGSCAKNYICSMLTAVSGGFHNFCDFIFNDEYKLHLTWRAETYNKC